VSRPGRPGALGRPRRGLGPRAHIRGLRHRLRCGSARTRAAARPTMDLHADSGQSTVEWLALMAMLIALAGVLIATLPDVGNTIVDTLGKLIRSVVP
jgi:hypothetical protein